MRTVSQWKELEGQRREEQFKAAAARQAARRAVDKAANEAAMHEASDRIGVAPGGGADVERKERLLAAFQSYDTNGDGFISAAELGSIETTLSFSDSHVGDLIREIDVDGDGRIDFEEVSGSKSWVKGLAMPQPRPADHAGRAHRTAPTSVDRSYQPHPPCLNSAFESLLRSSRLLRINAPLIAPVEVGQKRGKVGPMRLRVIVRGGRRFSLTCRV